MKHGGAYTKRLIKYLDKYCMSIINVLFMFLFSYTELFQPLSNYYLTILMP